MMSFPGKPENEDRLELGLARNTVRRFARAGDLKNCWSMTAPAAGPAFWSRTGRARRSIREVHMTITTS